MLNEISIVKGENNIPKILTTYGHLDNLQVFSSLWAFLPQGDNLVPCTEETLPEGVVSLSGGGYPMYVVLLETSINRFEFTPLVFFQLYGTVPIIDDEPGALYFRLMKLVPYDIQPERTFDTFATTEVAWSDMLLERMPLGTLKMPSEWDWKLGLAALKIPARTRLGRHNFKEEVTDEAYAQLSEKYAHRLHHEQAIALVDGREKPADDWPLFFRVQRDEDGLRANRDDPFHLMPMKLVPAESFYDIRLPPE